MQLFTRVLLLAVTVLGASAWPRMAGSDLGLYRMVMSSSSIDARALSPAEVACYNSYNNATNKNGELLSNATSACDEAANRTTVYNSQRANSSVALIRSQQLTVEQNLQLCKNETDNARYINCTVSHFDKNLQLLDSSNSLAYNTQSQFVSNASVVEAQRTSCISAAVSESKVRSIQTANDYDACLARIAYQRELAAPQEKPQHTQNQAIGQKPEQKPEERPEQRPVVQSQQSQQQFQQQGQEQPQQQSQQQPQQQFFN